MEIQIPYMCINYTKNENMNKTCRGEHMCRIYHDEICKEYNDEKYIANGDSDNSNNRDLHN